MWLTVGCRPDSLEAKRLLGKSTKRSLVFRAFRLWNRFHECRRFENERDGRFRAGRPAEAAIGARPVPVPGGAWGFASSGLVSSHQTFGRTSLTFSCFRFGNGIACVIPGALIDAKRHSGPGSAPARALQRP